MVLRNVLAGVGIVAVATVTAVAISAYGDPYDDVDAPPRLSISFRGLDLATPEGVDALDARVRAAVNKICDFHGTHSLTDRRLEIDCRDRAFASAEPQVERAIADARDSSRYPMAGVEQTVFTDLERQPGAIRRSVSAGIVRSLVSGVTANWYTFGAHGFVYASDRYRDDRGRSCGVLTVTSKSHGVQDVITSGRACVLPDEQFASL